MHKVNLSDKLALIDQSWSPRIVGELNGQLVKLVRFQGEFVWHHHEHEDELFLVLKGRFRMEFRDRHVWIEEGEFIVVPRTVEHRPIAEEEAHVLLFEPASTLNTGNVRNERTIDNPAPNLNSLMSSTANKARRIVRIARHRDRHSEDLARPASIATMALAASSKSLIDSSGKRSGHGRAQRARLLFSRHLNRLLEHIRVDLQPEGRSCSASSQENALDAKAMSCGILKNMPGSAGGCFIDCPHDVARPVSE